MFTKFHRFEILIYFITHKMREGSDGKKISTPERMRMVDSIKKSIHKSIQKINPAQYKNILKGQNIFMHLKHKGEVINSQYTKVALFMGAAVYKKGVEKITIVITNDISNKVVKKMKQVGKPILSVLWLEACFQEKRRVGFDEFFFKEGGKDQHEEEISEQNNINFEHMISHYQQKMKESLKAFQEKKTVNFIKFSDKRDKNHHGLGWSLLPAREIQLGHPKRKSNSITVNDKKSRKNLTKNKGEMQSQGNLKQKWETSEDQFKIQSAKESLYPDLSKQDENGVNNIGSRTSDIYEKYFNDYKQYQEKYGITAQITGHQETPCFINFKTQVSKEDNINQNENENENKMTVIPETPEKSEEKDIDLVEDNDQLLRTYSMKKSKKKVNGFKFGIPHPLLANRISKVNKIRDYEQVSEIQIVSSDNRDLVWVISRNSKFEALFGHLSKARLIVDQKIVQFLESKPLTEIDEKLLKQYQIKFKINFNKVKGKRIALLDSVIGSSSLEDIIKFLGGTVLKVADFLFEKNSVDFVISNKKSFFKSGTDKYTVLTEAKLIDILLQFE